MAQLRFLGLLGLLALPRPGWTRTPRYPLMYGDSLSLKDASNACITSFNAKVNCTAAIGYLYGDPFPDFEETVLDDLCTTACFNSLVYLRADLLSKCSSTVTYLDLWEGSVWPVTYLVDLAIFNYNQTCLLRSDGQYCNTWFQTGVNSSTVPECDECYINTAHMQAELAVKGDIEQLKSEYASMTSMCSYEAPEVTRTNTGIMISSPTATPECTTQYDIQPGDTAIDISISQKVATRDLLTANGLDYDLEKFPDSGQLCVRNQCKTYLLQRADTCHSINEAEGVSLAQMIAWNPFIDGHCTNIGNFTGQTICLSNPLGVFRDFNNTDSGFVTRPAPVPEDIAPGTTSDCGLYHRTTAGEDCGVVTLKYGISLKDFIFLNPMVWENCTNLWVNTSYCTVPVGSLDDYPGYLPPETPYIITPDETTEGVWFDPFADEEEGTNIPIANQTRTDCWDYLWWDPSTHGYLPSCWDVASYAGITNEEFLLWNPSLDRSSGDGDGNDDGNTDNDVLAKVYNQPYPCTISPSVSYCWALASPTPVVRGKVAPPSPRGAGEIATCTRWFQSSLSCTSHLGLLRISMEKMFRFNPSVREDCSGFVLGTYYCHASSDDIDFPEDEDDSGTMTSAPIPTMSSAGPIAPMPTPTQEGMVAGCTSFYYVVSGDGCWDIANDHGIPLEDLIAWNPALGEDCSGLWPEYYVCVGRTLVPTSAQATTTLIPPTATASTTPTGPTATPTAPPMSDDGICGPANGKTCLGSEYGDCCSASGWCGRSAAHCSAGCQTAFGACNEGSDRVSPDGSCGGAAGYTCVGSEYGDCCSEHGWCGATSVYCTEGCQSAFGICGGPEKRWVEGVAAFMEKDRRHHGHGKRHHMQ